MIVLYKTRKTRWYVAYLNILSRSIPKRQSHHQDNTHIYFYDNQADLRKKKSEKE